MREKEKSTTVVYVRHGQADFPYDRLYCDDREDPGLSDDGRRQAAEAGEMLAGETIDTLIASPMLRTRTTAEAIQSRHRDLSMTLDGRLKERPFGIWDGLYFDDIARDYPEGFKEWKRNPIEFVPEGGETIRDHYARVTGAMAEHIEAHRGETIVVAAHVGPIRMCVCAALGIPVEHYRWISIDYGSLTRIDYGRSQNNLIYLNRRLAYD